MKKYLLLRMNNQTGPHSLEELSAMGLTSHDLLWIDGKSASWKHPAEVEELKSLVHGAVEKKFDRVPMQRTRLKNDNILFRTQNNVTQKIETVLTEKEVLEFPTLARFFMMEHYETYRHTVKAETADSVSVRVESAAKKSGVWVSLPSAQSVEKIILISAREKRESEKEIKTTLFDVAETVQGTDRSELPESISVSALPVTEIKEITYSELQNTATPLPETPEDIIAVKSYANIDQLIAEVINTDNDGNDEMEGAPVIYLKPRSFISSFSGTLQKLAVAVAVGSLLTVAYLITDSILNPAYSLQPLVLNNKTAIPSDKTPATLIQPKIAPAMEVLAIEKKNEPTGGQELTPEKEKPVKKKVPKKEGKADELILQEQHSPSNDLNFSELTEPVSVAPLPVQVVEPRASLSELVDIKMEGMKVGLLGGIREFELVVKNNSDYSIDQLVVELKYIQSNKKVFKTEVLEFSDISAQSRQMVDAPKSSRGIKVESSIKSIASKEVSTPLNN